MQLMTAWHSADLDVELSLQALHGGAAPQA
jgi:hypothetical protein